MQLSSLLLSYSLLYFASASSGRGKEKFYLTAHSSESSIDLQHFGVTGDGKVALNTGNQIRFFRSPGLEIESSQPHEYAVISGDNSVVLSTTPNNELENQLREGEGRDFFVCVANSQLYSKQPPSSCSNAVSVTLSLDDPVESVVIPGDDGANNGYGSGSTPMTIPAYTLHPW